MSTSPIPPDDFKHQRFCLVDWLRERGIQNEVVLQAMSKVPRHQFVPAAWEQYAYADRALPIGYDQTISQPYVVAYMVEQARLAPHHRVLEVGAGCGYEAAILGELVDAVYSLEIVPELARSTHLRLQSLGYGNIEVRLGNGYQGWPELAPFDRILVTAAPSEIPWALVEQLRMYGRLIVPVGTEEQSLVVVTHRPEGYFKEEVLSVRFVPMVGE